MIPHRVIEILHPNLFQYFSHDESFRLRHIGAAVHEKLLQNVVLTENQTFQARRHIWSIPENKKIEFSVLRPRNEANHELFDSFPGQ